MRVATAALAAAAAAAALVPRAAVLHAPPAVAAGDDVVWSRFRSPPFAPLNATSYAGVVRSTGRNYTAHLGVVEDASLFSIELVPGGCATHTNVSVSAAYFGCQLATNGGFFEFTPPACEYNLIVNGTTVQYPGAVNVNLGVSATNGTVVIGYMAAATYSSYHLRSLVSGAGWLVRDGGSYVNASREFQPAPWTVTFVTEKAPRTAIGVTASGALFSMVVDGVETEDIGLDLYEFAEVLIDAGAAHAINIDGGGSSDAVLDGKVWSLPTCEDTPSPICERPVTSITCIAYPPA